MGRDPLSSEGCPLRSCTFVRVWIKYRAVHVLGTMSRTGILEAIKESQWRRYADSLQGLAVETSPEIA